MTDYPATTPRVDWEESFTRQMKDAGFDPSVGARVGDPRGYPSFVSKLYEARRYRQRLADQGLKTHPRRQIPKKLQNFALAASHGVQPPTILAIWPKKEDIDLSSLPDEFVVKSNGGAGSRGVYPLRRVPGEQDTYEITDETRRRVKGAEVVKSLTTDPKLTGPWFAEELLVPDVGDSALPSDIKIYAFYGQLGYGFTRRAPLHRGADGWQDELEFRYFDGEGQDIEMRQEASRTDIPVSPDLQTMLEYARRLSAAVPLPFVRVDLYGTTKGVVMGEITLLPGGNQHYLPLQDARLGKLWEEAEMRLQIDLAEGRPFAILSGDHPVPENLRPYLPARSA
ncbi:ATP-grasp fold amidoligase family protein [Kytococcus sp. Marseille-QA3725]